MGKKASFAVPDLERIAAGSESALCEKADSALRTICGALLPLEKLDSPEPKVRKGAVATLGEAHWRHITDEVVTQLIRLLDDPEVGVRKVVISVLSKYGTAANAALPKLAVMEQDAGTQMQMHLRRAICQIRGLTENAVREGDLSCDVYSALAPMSIETLQERLRQERSVSIRRSIVEVIREKEFQRARQIVAKARSHLMGRAVEDIRYWYRCAREAGDREAAELLNCILVEKELANDEVWRRRFGGSQPPYTKVSLVKVAERTAAAMGVLVPRVAAALRREPHDLLERLSSKSSGELQAILKRARSEVVQIVADDVLYRRDTRPQGRREFCRSPEDDWLLWLVQVEPRVGLLGLSRAQKQHQLGLRRVNKE